MGAELRPTFELAIPETADRFLERAARHLTSRACPLCGLVAPDRVELYVPPSRQHLWSPELRVEVEPDGAGCRLAGTYGPHPYVWTLFVATYAGLAFMTFVALTFAFAQWMLHGHASALYAVPVLLLLALGARALGFVGQHLGKEQSAELRAFLDALVAEGALPDSAPRHSAIRATDASREDASAEPLRAAIQPSPRAARSGG